MTLGDQDDFRLNDARVADQTPARLQYHLRHLIAEMLVHRRHDGIAIACHCRHVVEIAGRQAPAEVDQFQRHAFFGRECGRARPLWQSRHPIAQVRLLRADMEGNTMGLKATVLSGASRSSAISTWQPNFFESSQSAPAPFVTRRQKTQLPGAAWPSFSISRPRCRRQKGRSLPHAPSRCRILS